MYKYKGKSLKERKKFFFYHLFIYLLLAGWGEKKLFYFKLLRTLFYITTRIFIQLRLHKKILSLALFTSKNFFNFMLHLKVTAYVDIVLHSSASQLPFSHS